MDLKTARKLKPGDRVVAKDDLMNLLDTIVKGDRLTIQTSDQYGSVKAARWITFGEGSPRTGGQYGLGDSAFAPLFEKIEVGQDVPEESDEELAGNLADESYTDHLHADPIGGIDVPDEPEGFIPEAET